MDHLQIVRLLLNLLFTSDKLIYFAVENSDGQTIIILPEYHFILAASITNY